MVLLLALFVSGCAGKTDFPPPPEIRHETYAPLADTSRIVFVLPIDGIGKPATLILADALAASLRDATRPAVISEIPNATGLTVYGAIREKSRHDGVVDLSVLWELRAPTGKPLSRVSHDVEISHDVWRKGGVEAVNLIIAKAEPYVIEMVSGQAGQPLLAQDAGSVKGAPPPAEMPSEVLQNTPLASSDRTPTQKRKSVPEGMSSNMLTSDDIAARPSGSGLTAPVRLEPAASLTEMDSTGEAPIEEIPEVEVPRDTKAAPGNLPPVKESAISQSANTTEMPDAQYPVRERANLPAGGMRPEGTAAQPADMAPQTDPRTADAGPDNTRLKPVVWQKQSFLIRGVTGAPGNGNGSLMQSIRQALRAQDLTVTDDPRQAVYEIVGRVAIGPIINGRQQARIVWNVNTMHGDEVGQAVQENTVTAGSLDGPWGRVANVVADAAVSGIQELFDKRGTRLSQAGRTSAFPNLPPLPREPGRAPPPNQ